MRTVRDWSLVLLVSALACMPVFGQVEPAEPTEHAEPMEPAEHAEPSDNVEVIEVDIVETTTAAPTEVRYIRSPLFFDDATPQPVGTIDTRLILEYVTESTRAARGTDDDIGFKLDGRWGPIENLEVIVRMSPINMGDGKDTGDGLDGNYDGQFGLLYRFVQEQDWVPEMSLAGIMRIPSGHDSSGVSAQFRGLVTKTIVGDLRAHLNGWVETVNGNNDPEARHFQWGIVIGMDAPMNDAKDLWMMMDYIHRSSVRYGTRNINMVEGGVEWKMNDSQSLHLTTQMGIDGNGDTPNFGAKIAYTQAIRY